ncbi:MAG: LysR substrate-binding domain-containing protein, partial [Hoylesella buccalis]
AALMDGKIDIGLVEGIVRQPSCKYSFLMKDELVAIVRSGHSLTLRGSITIGDLCKQPLVLREMGSGTLDVFERELKRHQLTLADMNVKLYLGSTESIKRFILHSNCMGIISIRAVRKEVLEGELKVIEIEDMKLERDFVFVEKHGESGQLVNVFKRFVTSECKG